MSQSEKGRSELITAMKQRTSSLRYQRGRSPRCGAARIAMSYYLLDPVIHYYNVGMLILRGPRRPSRESSG